MVGIKALLFAAACTLSVSASPLPAPTNAPAGPYATDVSPSVTAAMLLQIDPALATCDPQYPECATADQIAPAMNAAFARWGIKTIAEQVAMVAYMYFESAHFRYWHNVSPGRPGQGTRSELFPNYIRQYAAIVANPTELAAAMAMPPGDLQANAILATVIHTEDIRCGAAPWFLTSMCTPQIRAGLASGSLDGWHNFLSQCVGTTNTPDRDAPWSAAVKAFQTV